MGRFFRFVLLGSALAIANVAHAQQGDAADPPPEYTALVETALAESAAGRWLEARAVFRRAQELFPNARTLRAIGMASYELRDYVAAYRELTAALTEPRRPLTEAQRVEVEGLLLDIRAFIGRFRLPPHVEGDVLVVDGVDQAWPADGMWLFAPGNHVVEVRSGEVVRRGEWTVQGGELETLALREVPRPTTVTTVVVQAPEPLSEGSRIASYTLLGGGAAALAVGSIFWGIGARQNANVEGADPGTPWSSLEDDYVEGPRRVRFGIGLVSAGVAIAGAGLVLVTRDHGDDETSAGAETAVLVRPDGAGVRVRW